MLALEPQKMLNIFPASNPMAYGFPKARHAATAACFIVYCGIISVTDALWMWMGRNTTFQLRTITTIAAFALISFSVYLYPHLSRGFGTYCLILLTAGLGLALVCQNQTLLPEIHPQIPAVTLISAGLIFYQIQTRSITGTVLLLLACLGGIGFLWFNPIFFTPLILSIGGLALIFAGSVFRYLVILNCYSGVHPASHYPLEDNIRSTIH
jgi:hypothetical protein